MFSCLLIRDAYSVEAQLLRTFVAVARLGSFSAAATELGYTQAAVSQQIASLENDLKTQLLTRRPVAPTEVVVDRPPFVRALGDRLGLGQQVRPDVQSR